MLGQMANVMKKARRAEVRATTPTTLMVLDEARFRRLLNRSAAMQAAVQTSAVKRGIEPETLFEDTCVES
ncbi:hypothetical protein A8B76_01585 [Roseovarius indicus]|nr:hypothetical protein A8B76_01585 [Roseovarius indicus]